MWKASRGDRMPMWGGVGEGGEDCVGGEGGEDGVGGEAGVGKGEEVCNRDW